MFLHENSKVFSRIPDGPSGLLVARVRKMFRFMSDELIEPLGESGWYCLSAKQHHK